MYRKTDWDAAISGSSPVPADSEQAAQQGPGEASMQPALQAGQPGSAESSRSQIRAEGLLPAERHTVARTPAPTSSKQNSGKQKPGRSSRRKLLFGLLLVPAIGAAAWFGYHWWTVGRFIVSTDDAYVEAYNTTLAAKVPGYVTKVLVTDNERVRAGEVIATIDDGDYRLAVDSAREKIDTQQATIARIGHQIDAQQAAVAQAKAQLASAQAAEKRWNLELSRQNFLVTKDFASRQTLEQTQANRDQAAAGVAAARAAIDSVAENVEVLKGQRQEAIDTLAELKTALAKAERDFSFTVIRAPIDGVVGNRAVQVGDYVQPGQRLASIVPLHQVYIDANFKETQLARLRPGQPVLIAVDALPAHDITGTIEGLSPASGAVFSLLPPDNATGNFTKIVQRLPVRIRVPTAVADEGVLRPGMSVLVSVNTKAGAPGVALHREASR
jgi:membrane fusion protein, multidrug efflux system